MLNRERILSIARKAAEGKGYVLYTDFDEYLRELICKEKTLQPTKAGFIQYEIKAILLDKSNKPKDRYRYERHKEAQFYPL